MEAMEPPTSLTSREGSEEMSGAGAFTLASAPGAATSAAAPRSAAIREWWQVNIGYLTAVRLMLSEVLMPFEVSVRGRNNAGSGRSGKGVRWARFGSSVPGVNDRVQCGHVFRRATTRHV